MLGQIVNDDVDVTDGGYSFEFADDDRDAVVDAPASLRDVGYPVGGLETSEGEHPGDELFDALRIGEGALIAGLVFVGSAGSHAGELKRGLDDGDRGFELMRGVGDEGALLIEGSLETQERTFQSMSKRREFSGLVCGCGRIESPRICRNVSRKSGELAQRRKATMEDPRDERTCDENEQKHAGGIELDGAIDGMPDVLSGRSVEDGDEAEVTAAGLAGIDDARTGETEEPVVAVVHLGTEEAIFAGDLKGGTSRPVCRTAEEMTASIPNFVDIFRRDVKVGEIEHHVIADIFGILHGAEDGIGTAAKHEVKGAEVCVAFVSPRDKDDQHGRSEFDEEDCSDEAECDAGAAGHEEGSEERRYPRPRRVSMTGSAPGTAASSLRRRFET